MESLFDVTCFILLFHAYDLFIHASTEVASVPPHQLEPEGRTKYVA